MRCLMLFLLCACYLPAAEADGNAVGTLRYGWKDARWLMELDAVSRQLESPLFVDAELCEFVSKAQVTMEGTAKDWPEVMSRLCAELGKQLTKNEQFSLNEGEMIRIRYEIIERKGERILTLQRHVVKPK